MDIKLEFAQRLAQALDLKKVNSRPIDRKRYLSQNLGVTERHAGNYLSGEKIPTTEGMIELSRKLGVSLELLATGRGIPTPMDFSPDELTVLTTLSPIDRARLFQIGSVLSKAQNAA